MKFPRASIIALFAAGALAAAACDDNREPDGTGGTAGSGQGGSGGEPLGGGGHGGGAGGQGGGAGGQGGGDEPVGGGGAGGGDEGPKGPPVAFVRAFGGEGETIGTAAAFDQNGYLYVAGIFSGTTDFGNGPVSTSGPDDYDAFLLRLDPQGVPVWSLAFGGEGLPRINALTVDSAGAALVTGNFSGTTDLGNGSMTAYGHADQFIARFHNSGNLNWAKTYGNAGATVEGIDLVLDADHNIFTCGSLTGTAGFGKGPITSAGGRDHIFLMHNKDGALIWQRMAGDSGDQDTCKVAVDANGDAYAAVALRGSGDFGGGVVSSVGPRDLLAVKWKGNSGDFVAQYGPFGGAQETLPNLVYAKDDVLHLGGWFEGTIDFGGGPMTSKGLTDIFHARLDMADDGKLLASLQVGGSGSDSAYAQFITEGGDLVMGGAFDGVLDPGLGSMKARGTDIFYARYSESLTPVDQAGPFGDEATQTITAGTLDGDKLVLLAQFGGTVDFGDGPISSDGEADLAVVVYTLE